MTMITPPTDAAMAMRLIHAQYEAENHRGKRYYKPVTTLRLLRPVTHAALIDLIKRHKKPPTRLCMTYLCRDRLWLETLVTCPDNYTQQNHPVMPTTEAFMGLPIITMTLGEADSAAQAKTDRAGGKGSRGPYKKTLSKRAR